jgi:hypothetical protein
LNVPAVVVQGERDFFELDFFFDFVAEREFNF